MDELLRNKEFRARMSTLSPGIKHWFINALVDLFEQESEYVIDVLEDCRHELGRTAGAFLEEAEELRAVSRMHEERRGENSRSVSRASRDVVSRLSIINEKPRRDRRRRVAMSDDDGRSASSLSVPAYPVTLRSPSPSARTTRSLPVTPAPPDVKTIEEETRALMQTMHVADAQVERERERQQERLERIRRQKKMLAEDRTIQALKLLEKALEMDRMLTADKERQGKLLQDKLQEMKKKRGGSSGQDIPVIEDLEKY